MPNLNFPPRPLTPREREVIAELAQGYTLDEIGTRLYITRATVKTHIARARHAIGARNVVHLVVLAMRSGDLDEARAA